MSPAVKCLIILAVVAVCFITEIIPLAVTSMAGAIACGFAGCIPLKTVFSGLSDSTVVLFAGMFVVGAAMFHTGLAQKIGITVVNAVGHGENSLMIGCMAVACFMSGFLSNTGTCACLLPVVLGICQSAGVDPKRQLMPMAFACGAGGTLTMVGTPPNILAVAALKNAGLQPFGFFEFAYIGIPLVIVTIIYMVTIGKRFLPTGGEVSADKLDAAATEEATAKSTDPKKQVICAIILIAVIVTMAFGDKLGVTLEAAAVVGALVCVVTKCLTEKEAYLGIDWVTIFLFAGMMPFASALAKTGAGKLVAETVVSMLGDKPNPYVLTGGLFALSCGLTQFMSNTASAALLCPIGIAIANQLGAAPHAVLMAIAIAASCAYATPVGTPPNTLVLGPAGYTFMDYVKPGIPLIILSLIVSLIVLPICWPFFP